MSRFVYSRAWSRLQFRARSWINSRGGDTRVIASRILKPFLRDLEKTHGPQSWEQVHESWRNVLNQTIRYGGCSEYNEVEVFHHGRPMFNNLWKDIDSAQKRIWIDTYTLKADYTGLKTIDKLTAAAKRGCEVVIIVDAFGSHGLQMEHLQKLLDAGGHFYLFNKKFLKLWLFFQHHPSRTPWIRNHRKLIIVDDSIAYTGGMNIADEYSGKNILLSKQLTPFQAGETIEDSVSIENVPNAEVMDDYQDLKNYPKKISESEAKQLRLPFRDTHARLTGPCVNYLSNAFMESLEEVSDYKYDFTFPDLFAISERKFLQRAAAEREAERLANGDEENEIVTDPRTLDISGHPDTIDDLGRVIHPLDDDEEKSVDRGTFVQVLTSHPRKARRHLDRALFNVISHARKTCYITTPYFLPTRKMRNAIIAAHNRGCDIQIITTGGTTSDVPAMRLGSLAVYGKFLSKGIKIFEYSGRTLHSKTMVVDGICSSVGSYNFDRMSFASNLEIGIVILDTKTAANMESVFKEELANARELTYEEWKKRPWYIRLAGWILYNMMRILGP